MNAKCVLAVEEQWRDLRDLRWALSQAKLGIHGGSVRELVLSSSTPTRQPSESQRASSSTLAQTPIQTQTQTDAETDTATVTENIEGTETEDDQAGLLEHHI